MKRLHTQKTGTGRRKEGLDKLQGAAGTLGSCPIWKEDQALDGRDRWRGTTSKSGQCPSSCQAFGTWALSNSPLLALGLS